MLDLARVVKRDKQTKVTGMKKEYAYLSADVRYTLCAVRAGLPTIRSSYFFIKVKVLHAECRK